MGEVGRAASHSSGPAASVPNVRRNLFSSQASRPAVSSARSAPPALSEGALDANGSEIVVRNPDGGYQFSVTPPPLAEVTPTAEQEADIKLAEMLSNRSRQSGEADLLHAVKASLRRKVASLEHDKWMFEGSSRA